MVDRNRTTIELEKDVGPAETPSKESTADQADAQKPLGGPGATPAPRPNDIQALAGTPQKLPNPVTSAVLNTSSPGRRTHPTISMPPQVSAQRDPMVRPYCRGIPEKGPLPPPYLVR